MSSEPVSTDIEFDAWRDSLPAAHWSKYDLAACRLGWDAAKALRSQAGVSEPFAYTTKTSLEIMERSESRSGSFALFLPFEGMDEIKGVEFVPLYADPKPFEITDEMVDAAHATIEQSFRTEPWVAGPPSLLARAVLTAALKEG